MVLFVAFADDKARGDVECCEQRGRAVTDVAMGAAFGQAGHYRQGRLLTIERLDLRLLAHAEYERAGRRRQVEPDDVMDLIDEQRIALQLERLPTVRLQPESGPSAPDRGVREAGRACHRADRPVGRVSWRRAQHPLDHSPAVGRAEPRPGVSTRSFRNRRRRFFTICSCRPKSAPTTLLCIPSAQRRTIRQLADIERATRRRTCRFRYSRSSGSRTSRTARRPRASAMSRSSERSAHNAACFCFRSLGKDV